MYKDNVAGISIAAVFDDHNKSKDGLFPIKIRVIHKTGKRLSKDDRDWKIALLRFATTR